MQQEKTAKLRQAIAQFADFPKPGILFEDLNPLYKDRELFKILIEVVVARTAAFGKIDFVAGIEARGFILGGALARELDCGFIPVRKRGKLPGEVLSVSYALEYGEDSLEIQRDPSLNGAHVLILDDVFATGGTMKAVIRLIKNFTPHIYAGLCKDIRITDISSLGVPYFVVF